ncbi:glycosyltransferase [Micromonospora matsumotoense]|uniref:glycosyltransferase n=1 Tax=Micromonospora matsumotoense TaxID=121616 RepID=UPI001FDF5019|nr:glycosyltransferase [Micromonospora matsumotoense]
MPEAVLTIAVTLGATVLFLVVVAFGYGFLRPDRAKDLRRRPPRFPRRGAVQPTEVAVLIACRNGSATIGSTVRSARATGSPVYVVSDASTDNTAATAAAAGAQVLELESNVGKPAALHAPYTAFGLGTAYRAVAILDDDVLVEPDFVTAALAHLAGEVAIVVGHNVTWWPAEHRWNPWLAKRAYSYWNYQAVVRRIQSHFNVMNCISGSNSVYRTELLDVVLPQQPPYIVDDTYWVLETLAVSSGRSSTPPGPSRSCRTRPPAVTGTGRTCAGCGAPSRASSGTGWAGGTAGSTTPTCC